MMSKYELLMLAVPEITEDEGKALEKHVEDLVKKSGGSMICFDRWGKYRLAYPVNKNEYGVYFLARFEAPTNSDALKEIKHIFVVKLHTIVMRDMFTVLDAAAGAVYTRPLSLEETPVREAGSFMREGREGREGGRGESRGGFYEDRRRRTLPEETSAVEPEEIIEEDDDSAE
jgi:small subunit ribosomal protein S6